jgi:hypothetical protein
MENRAHSVLANVVGASTALAGVAWAAPCSGGGCLACLRCASVGAGVVIATLLFRRTPGREEQFSKLPSEQ